MSKFHIFYFCHKPKQQQLTPPLCRQLCGGGDSVSSRLPSIPFWRIECPVAASPTLCCSPLYTKWHYNSTISYFCFCSTTTTTTSTTHREQQSQATIHGTLSDDGRRMWGGKVSKERPERMLRVWRCSIHAAVAGWLWPHICRGNVGICVPATSTTRDGKMSWERKAWHSEEHEYSCAKSCEGRLLQSNVSEVDVWLSGCIVGWMVEQMFKLMLWIKL